VSIDTRTILSEDRVYRYALWRCWGNPDEDGYLAFIGLNPSTADEHADDPTIRRCIGFAKREGVGALCMLNLFAFRATEPKAMRASHDPVGADTDAHLARCLALAKYIVLAWGTHGGFLSRDLTVIRLIRSLNRYNVVSLGLTKDGHPKHPLYIRSDQPLEPFPPPYREAQANADANRPPRA
jgi:hypothetical protein